MNRMCAFASLVMLAFLTACSSRPATELSEAERALEAARTAEADIYAKSEFQTAQETWKEAQAEIMAQDQKFALTRSYERARTMLSQAVAQAETAVTHAKANKEQARRDAEAALREAQMAIQTAVDALAKAPKGKGTKGDLEALQSDLNAAQTALSDAQATLQTGKYLDALNQFKAVKGKAEMVNGEIQQAIQKKRRG